MYDAARFMKIEAAAAPEMIGRVSYKDEGLCGVIAAHPGAFAATVRSPGGYGINPYGAGADARVVPTLFIELFQCRM